jgi:TetR/AcrR family transcriptional regulator, regulator of cefoperazone and chloramphenicol sensitivity
MDRAPEDLTARARIRDAALRLFAERGIDAATIRDIAAEAGVSSGLVRHHFGSKEALRDACDAYATEHMARIREQAFVDGRLSDQAFMAAQHPTSMLLQAYLVRSMVDGSEAGAKMFEDGVRLGEQWLTDAGIESPDLRAYATALVAAQLGVFLLHEQVSRALGVDVHTAAGHARLTSGMVDLFAHPLVTPDQAAQAHAALARLQAHPSEGAGQQ